MLTTYYCLLRHTTAYYYLLLPTNRYPWYFGGVRLAEMVIWLMVYDVMFVAAATVLQVLTV